MWQMVSYVPTTLSQRSEEDITLLSAKLATSFFLDSFIHAKEKLNIVQWVESLTKQVFKLFQTLLKLKLPYVLIECNDLRTSSCKNL